jgi:hypothetical protein
LSVPQQLLLLLLLVTLMLLLPCTMSAKTFPADALR